MVRYEEVGSRSDAYSGVIPSAATAGIRSPILTTGLPPSTLTLTNGRSADVSDHRQTPRVLLRGLAQLRGRDRPPHALAHDSVAPVDPQGHPVDVGDAEASARTEEAAEQVPRRSSTAQRRDDAVLQGEQHQPHGGLFSVASADAGVLRPLSDDL